MKKILAIVKGGEFKFFGFGRELFFVFTSDKLFVLKGSMYKRLFANSFLLGAYWSLGKLLNEWKELENFSLEELSREAEFEFPYSEIKGYKLNKKMGIAHLEFITSTKSYKFVFPFIIPSKIPSPRNLLFKGKIEGYNPIDFFPSFLEGLNILRIE